jgi:tetratricopeptide (TPR) repeat protein
VSVEDHHARRGSTPELAAMVGVVVATLAAYVHVASFGFVAFDDPIYVFENPHLVDGLTEASFSWAFTTFYFGNWHPLTWLSYLLDYEVYGLDPAGYHATNLALHVFNVALVYTALRLMWGSGWKSVVVAALFGLHPLHVESVAWVSERKDVLCTFFWLLTMVAYTGYVRCPRLGRYLVVLLSFSAGLMAKSMIVTLPFVLLLLDFWPLRRLDAAARGEHAQSPSRLLLEKLPLFLLSAVGSVLTYLAQSADGSVKMIGGLPLHVRVMNASITYVSYIKKAFWPVDLGVLYPYDVLALSMWKVGASIGLLGLMTGLVIREMRPRPYLAVGWLWYLGTLVPVIGLVQVGQQAMADRFTYVPMIGLYVMVTWALSDLASARSVPRFALSAMTTALLACLAVATSFQVRHWRDSEALFERSLAVNPRNLTIRYNLGIELQRQGRIDEALHQYREAVRINPSLALAHINLGLLLLQEGRVEESIGVFREALDHHPELAPIHDSLGVALARAGRFADAVKHFEIALQLDPESARTRQNLQRIRERRAAPPR